MWATLLLYGQIALGSEKKTRILIFSGANNHNWKETTPVLEHILKDDPNFLVKITNHPENITEEQLAEVDVVVSNWNNFKNPEIQWNDAVRKAFIDFVRNGGGHVTIHAGGSSFNDWQEYHQIAAYWGKGTYHGPAHEFTVNPVDVEHPIIHGLKPFKTNDELWNNSRFPAKSITLMTAFSSKEKRGSGKAEPVLTVNSFGKGRCVNFMLGHNKTTMNNSGFKTLLLRSTKWAAHK